MQTFCWRDDEVQSTRVLIDELERLHTSVESSEFQYEAGLAAQELPRRLRSELRGFRLREPTPGVMLISGFPVDQERIGRTPGHWSERQESNRALREEILLILVGMLCGEPVAWSTQQGGQVVHDVLPIKGHEQEQLGSGSEQLLWWHTEDAFHPYRGDHLLMMCIRNPDKVPTTYCSIDAVSLTPEQRHLLFEPLFPIRPDESHLPKNQPTGGEVVARQQHDYEAIEKMRGAPERISVLFGSQQAPYWRLDPYFMDRVEAQPAAQKALDELVSDVDRNLKEVALEPGDICVIDNFRVVHGRRPFRARYDGFDRWLKRINVACDLRKSRAARTSAEDRVLGG